MFDIAALQKLAEPLAWFLTLGKSDTEHMRSELLDLLTHTGQSVRSLIELEKTLAGLKEAEFSKDKFMNVYLHCKYVFTGNDASERARTHCTDIQRDVRRINFVAAKVLRTEMGNWKNVDKSFADLENADDTFLSEFGGTLRGVDAKLDEVQDLLDKKKRAAAWAAYETLRKDLRRDVDALSKIVDQLRKAEDHIRSVLT
jgi:hypothetical protein